MGKVLPFHRPIQPPEPSAQDKAAKKLLAMSTELDQLILAYLHDPDLEAIDVVGLVSHRLGTLMRHIDRKSELWEICEQVLRRQALLAKD